MKRAIRILGIVACLATVWLVTRGSNGCAPTPDFEVLEVESPELEPGDPQLTYFDDAEVYGSGKIGKVKKEVTLPNGKKRRTGTATVMWYAALQGNELAGVLTVVSADGQWHTHAPFKVEKGKPQVEPIQLPKMVGNP